VLCSRAVVLCLTSYVLLVFVQVVFDELLPVLEELAPALGGLGYSAAQSGGMQVVAGIAHVATQAIIFPLAVARCGVLRVFRASLLPLIAIAAFPLVHLAGAGAAGAGTAAAGGAASLATALGAALIIKTAAMALSFSTIILLTNNCSRGHYVALVTGLSQTVASAVRAVGPTVGGALFSASLLAREQLGPHNIMLTYAVLTLVVLVCAATAAFVPAFVDRPPDYSAITGGESAPPAAVEGEAALAPDDGATAAIVGDEGEEEDKDEKEEAEAD
jgi:hypothetical protein